MQRTLERKIKKNYFRSIKFEYLEKLKNNSSINSFTPETHAPIKI